MALRLIDRVGLYCTIFTNPANNYIAQADIKHWNLAYDQLLAIHQAPSKKDDVCTSLSIIHDVLLKGKELVYLAWLLCAFVPWARVSGITPVKLKAKLPSTVAASVAREGITADNKEVKIINNAILFLPDILKTRSALNDSEDTAKLSLKRKRESHARETLGVAIRRWGIHWQSSVMYALLVEVTEATDVYGGFEIGTNDYSKANSSRPRADFKWLYCVAVENQGIRSPGRSIVETNCERETALRCLRSKQRSLVEKSP